MDKVPQLGKLITDEQFRDAVHIAVAPVTAGEDLRPSQRIGFTGDAYTVGRSDDIIGIVDPFLPVGVKKGEKFYMFLLPNTITSLRHEWTHPSFEKEDMLAEMEPTFFKIKGNLADEQWIRDYAEGIGTNYEDLMDAAQTYQSTGDYFCQGGDFEGECISDEFWEKYESVTRSIVTDRSNFLTCSC